MNAGVDFVKNPVRLICILRGSGVLRSMSICTLSNKDGTYRCCIIFQQSHRVLHDHLVLEADQLYDLLHDPRTDD